MKKTTPKTFNLLPDEMEALARIHTERQLKALRGEITAREAAISRSVGEALKAMAATLPKKRGK